MTSLKLQEQLLTIANRVRWSRFALRFSCLCVGLAAVVAGLMWAGVLTVAAAVWLTLMVGGLLAGIVWRCTPTPAPLETARLIEAQFPELEQRLLTATEVVTTARATSAGYLQQELLTQTVVHSWQHDWTGIIARRRWVFNAATVMLAVLLWSAAAVTARVGHVAVEETTLNATETPVAAVTYVVQPRNLDVERGSPVTVTIEFPETVPAAATLVLQTTSADQNSEERLPMRRGLADPLFGVRLSEVTESCSYFIEFDGHTSEVYSLNVFESPAVETVDVTVRYPAAFGQTATVQRDVRSLTVTAGATLEVSCSVNQPLHTVELRAGNEHAGHEAIVFTEVEPLRWTGSFTPRGSGVHTFALKNAAGRSERVATTLDVQVLPNRRPNLQFAFPGKDVTVSPLEELHVQAAAADDFGVARVGLVYQLNAAPPQTVWLAEDVPADTPVELTQLVALEELKAQPDDVVSYHLIAEDLAEDGTVRTTLSDMFFADVRPFEEVYRQGPSGGGGGAKSKSPQAKKADELAKLQKQIVSALWTQLRQQDGTTQSIIVKTQHENLRIIQESQRHIHEQAAELAAKLKSPQSQSDLKSALAAMLVVTQKLTAILNDEQEDSPPEFLSSNLTESHTAARSAYQALLKLRAREHRVSQGQGGGGGGGSRSQKQLDQLQLAQKEQKYQQPGSAAAQPPAANSEQLQVLNRLRELAQRQQALNQQMREVEHQLRTAANESEQQAAERRLKRLREQQQETLRDVDNLQNRLAKSPQREQLAQTQQRVQQTRQQVRQASEALQKGQLGQAQSAGAKAARDFEQLQDKLRRQTANQFADALKHLQQAAERLAVRQSEIEQGLSPNVQPSPRSLRDVARPDAVRPQLEEQRRELDTLLDDVQRIVQQAEQAEPVLAQQLYDTVRNAGAHQPQKRLAQAAQELQRRQVDAAAKDVQAAGAGIQKLQAGINKAAESILGDELASLQRARSQLDTAADRLKQEAADRRHQGGSAADQNANTKNASASADPGNSKQQREGVRVASASSEQAGSRTDLQRGQSSSQPGEQKTASATQSQQSGSAGETKSPSTANGGQKPAGQSPGSAGKTSSERQQSSGEKPGGDAAGKSSSSGQSSGSPGSSSSSGKSAGQSPGKSGSPSGGKPSPGSPSSSSGRGTGSGGSGATGGPLTGSEFTQWSDRLREIEELVSTPQQRARVAKIREAARAARVEFVRHAKEPDWQQVDQSILQPLAELSDDLAEEIARRQSPDALVPIDRDPVPQKYADAVRKYYERLGQPLQ